MKRLIAAAVAAVALLTAIPAPAQADVGPSIEILTEKAIAQGNTYVDSYSHKLVIFRPVFTLSTEVVCPAGAQASVLVPVWAHTAPGVFFTCTGAPQVVNIPFTATFHNMPGRHRDPITATLWLASGTAAASDTEVVAVTLIAKSVYR